MALSPALFNVLLTRPCPHCGHNLEKTGSWFKVIHSYRCEGCHADNVMSYPARVELFEAHAHLTSN